MIGETVNLIIRLYNPKKKKKKKSAFGLFTKINLFLKINDKFKILGNENSIAETKMN